MDNNKRSKDEPARTRFWVVNPDGQPHASIQQAAQLIRSGEVVAFPTETVYGLGADARNTEAVEKLYAAKGRPSDNPLIVHISNRSQLAEFSGPVSETASRLMELFWPGPLTIILPVKENTISQKVTAGLPTVAVRMPNHPVALRLIEASGCPVAAPSANRSGRPSPTLAKHVLEDMDGNIAAILDGGAASVGMESTVVEAAEGHIHILRPGGISMEQLRQVTDHVTVDRALQDQSLAPKSPGMKYTHYAPKGNLILVKGGASPGILAAIQNRIDAAKSRGERTGVLTYTEHAAFFDADLVIPCGNLLRLETAAAELYAALRTFDEAGVTYIVAEGCPEEGIGLAVMNRLNKAAGGQVIEM